MQLEKLSSVIHNSLWSVENTEYLNDLKEIIESKEEYCFDNDTFLNYHFPEELVFFSFDELEKDFVIDTLRLLRNKNLVDSMTTYRMLNTIDELRETNSMNYVSNYYKSNN